MTITTQAQAKRRIKEITESIKVYETALGRMEADGWFGGGPSKKGLSCTVDKYGYEITCDNGGPECAGIAIYWAAEDRCHLRRWNRQRTSSYIARQLDGFLALNDFDNPYEGVHPQMGSLRGLPAWNDSHGVTYTEVKAAFGNALRKLVSERDTLSNQFCFFIMEGGNH